MATARPVIPQRTFKQHETGTLDTPFAALVTAPCASLLQPLLQVFYKIRWMMAHPLTTRLIPSWVCLPPSANITVGQLILLTPLVVWFLQCYHSAVVAPNVEDSGKYATYAIIYCFLTANKSNSLFSFLFGIPFERMIATHLICSVFAVVMGYLHVRCAFLFGGSVTEQTELGSFLVQDFTNITGGIALAAMMALVSLSLFPILRRWAFNLWLVTHVLLAVTVLVSLIFHDVMALVLIAMWWILDLVVRYGIMASCRYRVRATIRRIAADSPKDNEPAVEISFPKPAGFEYNPGQFIQMALPQLSIFEFHPISISSSPHEEMVTLHVRTLGDWTTRLLGLTSSTSSSWGGSTVVDLWMEGPYGCLSVDLDDDTRYKMALFVSGGIGVTPCQSIGKSLLHQHQVQGRNLKYFKFVWAVRDMNMVKEIPPLGGEEDFSCRSPWYRRQSSLVKRKRATLNGVNSADLKMLRDLTEEPSTLSHMNHHGTTDELPSSSEPRQQAQPQRLPAVAQVDIYCTRKAQKDKNNSENDSDDDNGTEEALPYNVYQGRPDLDAIFEEMKETALGLGEHSVAVFGCGPKTLMSSLEGYCRKHSQSVVGCGNGVFFDLHVEHFEF